jgi:hypothetical protein
MSRKKLLVASSGRRAKAPESQKAQPVKRNLGGFSFFLAASVSH